MRGNPKNPRDAVLVDEYYLISEIGLSYDELRDIPYRKAKKYIKIDKERKEYEEELKEKERRRQERQSG